MCFGAPDWSVKIFKLYNCTFKLFLTQGCGFIEKKKKTQSLIMIKNHRIVENAILNVTSFTPTHETCFGRDRHSTLTVTLAHSSGGVTLTITVKTSPSGRPCHPNRACCKIKNLPTFEKSDVEVCHK